MTAYCNSLLWQYEMNQVAINYVLSLIFHFLGFTQFTFYPGFTQLPRVKLVKTVWRFFPPTLIVQCYFALEISLYLSVTMWEECWCVKIKHLIIISLISWWLDSLSAVKKVTRTSEPCIRILYESTCARFLSVCQWCYRKCTVCNSS